MIYFYLKVVRGSHPFTVASCFLCILIFNPANLLAEEKPVGKILSVIGTVKFFTDEPGSASKAKAGEVKTVSLEPWEKVKKKQLVYAKDQFRTSRKSRLKVLFSDNSMMALGPGAEMSIDSYRTKPKSKLRQGVVNVKRGLSMYIVNKSQKNKKSFFNIVTPTANIGARGTQGYVAASSTQTLIANQAGAVATKSSDSSIGGQANVGPMMKTSVALGAPPAIPTTLSSNELSSFRNLVVGDLAYSGGSPNAMISVDESKEDKEKEEDKEEGEEREKGGKGEEGDKRGEGRPEGKDGPGGLEAGPAGGSFAMDMGGGKFDFAMLAQFEGPDIGKFGSPADFAPVFNFFNDVDAESCSR